MKLTLLLIGFIAAASAMELTSANWDDNTAGKTTFIKFFAPWCGHCKKMKPDWDKLMTEYADSTSVLIAEVDCTAGGKDLCSTHGVQGYPTLKYGDPTNLEDYEGGRDYTAFKKFASELKPLCSPSNMDLCDEEGKAAIEKVQAMSDDDITAAIADGDKKLADAETTFSEELEKLQAAYKTLQENKESTIAEVKSSGLGLLKAVFAARKKAPAKEEL